MKSQDNRFYLSRKLVWMITAFVIAASGLVVLTNFSINMIAASGDYSSLISKWSQYHYESGIFLERYGRSGNTKYYDSYQHASQEKDKIGQAISELFNTKTDAKSLFDSYSSSHVYPNQVSSLLFAFNTFDQSQVLTNIKIKWDALETIEKAQDNIVDSIHETLETGSYSQGLVNKKLAEYNRLNQQWNINNRELLNEVGKASLIVKRFGLWISVILGILLVLIGVVVSVRAGKSIRKWEQTLNEKDILLSEIHHRVKNNLAVISGLLELESMQENGSERALQESRDRIQSMAMIHELLYQSNSFSKVDFKDYMHQLTDYLQKTYLESNTNFRFSTHLKDVVLSINQAIPTGLLINEILSSTLEKSLSGGHDELLIKLDESDEQVTITVQSDEKASHENFKAESSGSTGKTIINTLVSQLNARLRINKEPGTLFELTFAKSDAPGSANANL